MHKETRVSNYFLATFATVSLVLLSLPLAGPVRSFKACLVYLLEPAAYYGAKGAERLAAVPPGVGRLLAADMENRRLQEEIKKAVWIKAEADALRAENARLTASMSLAPRESREPLWARVMEREPLHWYRSLMVSAGAAQGVELNAPVLGRRGDTLAAVGRVVEVRPKSSVVLLLTDELSSVAASLSSAAVDGLIQGQGGPRLRMNYLQSDAALTVGDLVHTSQTSATFPGDILIGRVSTVNPRDPFLTFQSVEVDPAVDASGLKEVLLLKTLAPPAPPLAAAPAAGAAP